MKATVLTGFGGTENFSVQDVPNPQAGPGQVRVRIEAIGINPLEFKIRLGWMQQFMPITFPAILGSEVAGTVDQVGEGVTDFALGDRVAGFVDSGAYAEAALARPAALIRIPPQLTFEQAVTLPLAAETAQRALAPLKIQSGETVVVNGAAGGVGTIAVQLLVQDGARVIGTASAANAEYVRSLGAEPVTYGEGALDRIRALAPQGVDAVFDVAGHGFLNDAIALRGGPDRIITIADFDAPALGIPVSGGDPGGLKADTLQRVIDLAAQGKLTTHIDHTFAFDQLPDAQAMSEAGHVRGKLVVRGSGR
ncbi:NADP-dependent oxidoreductase [Deinococcus sp. KSM4-11]|uniref:NADP-dependent oxidoreductase n=1 Tax=Deinococcus sp. KSM4-11 TaxID=2568654 RepID=UPI0010A38BFC|nr:NADP-dependent oxidoreductase [Deinococcus sp. KSM4-11]THF83578.1 NADP-dependent oxidoreductase [Deinococcus sp. KSM4-11]